MKSRTISAIAPVDTTFAILGREEGDPALGIFSRMPRGFCVPVDRGGQPI
jgi:hypothetical protein